MVTQASNIYIKLYGHYKNGVLPFAGGLLDQPNPYIDAMSVIDERLQANDGNGDRKQSKNKRRQ